MKWVKIVAQAGPDVRVMWISPRRIISVLEPIAPGMPGGIVVEGRGIFDIAAEDVTQLLHDIAIAEEGRPPSE